MYSVDNRGTMSFGTILLNCAFKVVEAMKLKKRPKVKVDSEDTRCYKMTSFDPRKTRMFAECRLSFE